MRDIHNKFFLLIIKSKRIRHLGPHPLLYTKDKNKNRNDINNIVISLRFCCYNYQIFLYLSISIRNKFIENPAADIKLAFPDAKGYYVRNLKYMAKFAATYEDEGGYLK